MSKKVRLLAQISGSRDGKPWPAAGNFVTVSDDEADTLVRNGQAAVDEIEENALLDTHPELALANRSVAGEEAADERLAEKPAPHADEPGAYHVPELPGERAAAEAGQKVVDEAQADAGAQRVESTTEDPKPVLDGEATKRAPRAPRKATEK